MQRILTLIIALTLFQNICLSQTIAKKNLVKNITYLASDSLHGRGSGTADEKKASEYIAKAFKKYKLEYLPGNNSYFQNFTIKVRTNPHSEDTVGAEVKNCRNVIGYIDNKSAQTIVLGAHYDHLGLGHDHNSLDANPEGKIHNGADDNASGTAGVMELARVLSKQKGKLKYNIIICLFSGEELGLVGSKKFVENNQLDSSKIAFMFNFDMIGRMNDSSKAILIMGYGTCLEWGKIVPASNQDFSLKYDSAGIGPSDYTSFYLQNIPVLGFFTGQHSDYHKPSDDIEKINFDKEVEVLEFALRLIKETEKYPKLTFAKTANKESGKTSLKVTLGIMPDYVYDGKGLKIDGVSEGKPAFKAGIIKGDIILKFDDVEVNNMQDYMKVLQQTSKGQTRKVTIKRGNEILVLDVNF